MRFLVIGSTGSGKSTFARELARRIAAPYVEMDALNWDPGWTNLSQVDRDRFRARVTEALSGERWTCDGNYSAARDIALARATHLVWLDYSRPVIMRRVIWRSFSRAISGRELWAGTGNREEFRRWLDKEHPIRWAWDTFHHRRGVHEQLLAAPQAGHLKRYRLRHPREAAPAMARLAAQALPIPAPEAIL
jgi:adenylate kinase family enzyme